jgi:hypothetical protein
MSWTIVGTGVLFGLAQGLLGAFFATKNPRFDRAAELSFVAFGALAIPAILEVDQRLAAGPLTTVVLLLGIVGAAGTGLGELVITLRLIDFRRVAMPITLAFVAFLAWIGGVSLLSVTGTGIPTEIAWLGIAAIAIGVVSIGFIARQPGVITGESAPGTAQVAAMMVALVGIVAWLIWLGAAS